jgi:hypothetical protein
MRLEDRKEHRLTNMKKGYAASSGPWQPTKGR